MSHSQAPLPALLLQYPVSCWNHFAGGGGLFIHLFIVQVRVLLCSPDYTGASSVDQASLQLQRSAYICLRSAKSKGTYPTVRLLLTSLAPSSEIPQIQQHMAPNSQASLPASSAWLVLRLRENLILLPIL